MYENVFNNSNLDIEQEEKDEFIKNYKEDLDLLDIICTGYENYGFIDTIKSPNFFARYNRNYTAGHLCIFFYGSF